MNSDNQQVFFCLEEDEFCVYCEICDNLCIEKFYKNYLESKTRNNNIRKEEQLKKTFQIISLIQF